MYIKVTVTPNNKKENLEQIKEDTFKLSIREKAENNLANNRVREIFAQKYLVEVGKVRIISGHHSPKKILSINT